MHYMVLHHYSLFLRVSLFLRGIKIGSAPPPNSQVLLPLQLIQLLIYFNGQRTNGFLIFVILCQTQQLVTITAIITHLWITVCMPVQSIQLLVRLL